MSRTEDEQPSICWSKTEYRARCRMMSLPFRGPLLPTIGTLWGNRVKWWVMTIIMKCAGERKEAIWGKQIYEVDAIKEVGETYARKAHWWCSKSGQVGRMIAGRRGWVGLVGDTRQMWSKGQVVYTSKAEWAKKCGGGYRECLYKGRSWIVGLSYKGTDRVYNETSEGDEHELL